MSDAPLLPPVDRERLLERFLRYVQVDTTAREDAPVYPSSEGQRELGRILAAELQAAGLEAVAHDQHGIVAASLSGNTPHKAPAIAFNAHLDTSPETTGKDVRPQVVRDYSGGPIRLPGRPDLVLRPEELPELQACLGHTLITTDGTTLLGGDDKAGVAVIMEAATMLAEHPEIARAPLRVLFTCDEEIGRGTDYVDVPALQATVLYTFDGAAAGQLDVETFSADLAVVAFRGVNIHPAIAKDRMCNSLRAAGAFLAALPPQDSPERTDGRQGFVHPYGVDGGVAQTVVRVLLRDFDDANLERWAQVVRTAAETAAAGVPGITAVVDVRRQYRNPGTGLQAEPRAADLAEEALRLLGRPCKRTIVRGGTDGSRFTEKGLPSPNLSCGQHNIHSPSEWASLDEMAQAVEQALMLAQLWARQQ